MGFVVAGSSAFVDGDAWGASRDLAKDLAMGRAERRKHRRSRKLAVIRQRCSR
jgi:hypothetical protein